MWSQNFENLACRFKVVLNYLFCPENQIVVHIVIVRRLLKNLYKLAYSRRWKSLRIEGSVDTRIRTLPSRPSMR